jgi:two-component system, cell cycle response regulator
MMPDNYPKSGEKTIQIIRSVVTEGVRPSPCFIIIGGMDTGRIIPIDQARITLGRDLTCTVVLGEDGVSRFHAEVELDASENAVLRDLGSTNGTFVNGIKIQEVRLNRGDKVFLGQWTILKYELYDRIEATYQKQIYESSIRDGLTGIYNRKYFNQRLLSDLSFAKRHALWFTLMIFDLDHFKNINDTFGHQAGDQVLKNVATSVCSMIRTEDIIARYGGEEFAIIAPGTDYAGGLKLGQRVLARVENDTETVATRPPGSKIKVTVSIGFATVKPGTAVEPAKLIAIADENLYTSKNEGRNCSTGSLMEESEPEETRVP